MRVVAVGTPHGAFVDAMFVWHIELRPNIGVAGVAQLRLRLRKQLSMRSRLVNGVAFRTDHAVVGVNGSLNVESNRVAGVTAQTRVHPLPGLQLGERDDRGLATMSGYMRLPRSVTAFAASCFTGLLDAGQTGIVRILEKLRPDVGMASAARLASDETFLVGRCTHRKR